MAANNGPEREGVDARAGPLPLWRDSIRSGGGSRHGRDLPLHRLSDADGFGLPGHGARESDRLQTSRGGADRLYQDRRQWNQARSRILSQMRLTDLRGGSD